MKKSFLWMLLALGIVAFSACSNDDAPSDPEGTVALNMLDEANGKTMLEDSGIYIDSGQNFVAGSNCDIFVLGQAGSLGAASIGNLSTPVSRAAVVSHQGYVACRPSALMKFPSGSLALPIGRSDVNYMKFWVQSPLKNDGKTIGAALKFVLLQPKTYGLPEFDSTKDFIMSDHGQLTMTLSSADFEYDFNAPDDYFKCEKKGRKLVITTLNYHVGDYTLWLRIHESYTKITIKATYNY